MAQRLGRDLAARGLVIGSGMARGIDAIGHQGAMDAHGRAIGVLGTGIDVCYPKENKKLYEKVLERGAIVSEFSLRTHPAPENFPVRNRIVAGLPLGVVVIEGAQYSGPADHRAIGDGIRQGSVWRAGQCDAARQLCAEPAHQTRGEVVTSAEDVIEELPTPVRAALVQAEKPESEQRNLLAAASLNAIEKNSMNC